MVSKLPKFDPQGMTLVRVPREIPSRGVVKGINCFGRPIIVKYRRGSKGFGRKWWKNGRRNKA